MGSVVQEVGLGTQTIGIIRLWVESEELHPTAFFSDVRSVSLAPAAWAAQTSATPVAWCLVKEAIPGASASTWVALISSASGSV